MVHIKINELPEMEAIKCAEFPPKQWINFANFYLPAPNFASFKVNLISLISNEIEKRLNLMAMAKSAIQLWFALQIRILIGSFT